MSTTKQIEQHERGLTMKKNFMKKLLRNKFGKNSNEYQYFMGYAIGLEHGQLENLFRDLYNK
jgi:hypothetical protein